MSNEVQIFDFEQMNVRTVIIDEEVWFVGKDVALILGYTNPQKALRDHVDDEDKGVNEMDTPGGMQNLTIINESGVFDLIIDAARQSKSPEIKAKARRFRHKVTSEILPSIRKTGSYQVEQQSEIQILQQTINVLAKQDERLNRVEDDMKQFKQNLGLPENMAEQLRDKMQYQVKFMMGGYNSNAYANNKVRAKVYRTAWRDLKSRFHVGKYRMIPAEKFQEAMQYVDFWNPDTNLKLEIQEANAQTALEV